MFNLMRNIGGSIGIAFATTYLERRTQVHINIMGRHVDAYSAGGQADHRGYRSALMARGIGCGDGGAAGVGGGVRAWSQRQASMLSFLDTFRLLAVSVFAGAAAAVADAAAYPQGRGYSVALTGTKNCPKLMILKRFLSKSQIDYVTISILVQGFALLKYSDRKQT